MGVSVRSDRELGAAVRGLRRERGLTQAEVARRAGVSRQLVVAIEGGNAPRTEVGRIFAVLRALGQRLTIEPDETPSFAEAYQRLTGSTWQE